MISVEQLQVVPPPAKRQRKRCEHERQRYRCKDCGGASICQHGRERNTCKDCGGASVCEHGRKRNKCKNCGGASICEHGRQRSLCKDCGGASICEHERVHNTCRDCGGASICVHGKLRWYCKDCGGSRICKHDRQRHTCKDCGGASICEHDRVRNTCKDCGGSQICGHGKQRTTCKDCGGSGICQHGRQRKQCNICSDCGHGRIAYKCKICDGRLLCKSSWCDTTGNRKYRGYCVSCFAYSFPDEPVSKNVKLKEIEVRDHVKATFPLVDWICDRAVADGCSRKRPDMLVDLGSHVLFVEIDETQHKSEGYNCETKRMMQLMVDVGTRPVVFVRFNPDAYTAATGETVSSCWGVDKNGVGRVKPSKRAEWSARLARLCQEVQHWLIPMTPAQEFTCVQLWYDEVRKSGDDMHQLESPASDGRSVP